jgi:lipopolysaccharide transport system ATP-binding protein
MSVYGKIKNKLLRSSSDTYNNNQLGDNVAIRVEHVSMEFKITKDKIDTLKEYVIRTIKRDKKEKEKIRVLDDITFEIYKGDKLGILGFNGAGKSTLLKILAGIYEPTYGKIEINGKVAPLLELSAGFDKNYTGKNNIYLNGAFLSMSKDFLDEKYDEIVEFSELGEFIDYPVKNYSSGMRAKLGFSIATLIEPDILIVDEILSVGDIKFRKKSSEKINELMAEGVTVLLVSHSINQIRKICDKCIWIDNGKIIMQGPSEEVCDAYVENAEGNKKKKKKKKRA